MNGLSSIRRYCMGLPKAELHVHIEGTLEPPLQKKIAERNELAVDDCQPDRRDPHYKDLQQFLDQYYAANEVLRTEEDFFEVAEAYLKTVKSQGVMHADIFFDPQAHMPFGVSMATMVNGLTRAFKKAEKEWGITTRLILCFLRHLSEEAALQVLKKAATFLDRIHGVGLDSAEVGNPCSKFQGVFKEAEKLGLHRVAHAGEEGPAENITEAIELLHVERVDHGVRCLERKEVVKILVDMQINLTVCPVSNVCLSSFSSLKSHPLPVMMRAGLNCSINSDDPAFFGGYIGETYAACAEEMPLSRQMLKECAENSIKKSFATEARKREMLEALEKFERQFDEEENEGKQGGSDASAS